MRRTSLAGLTAIAVTGGALLGTTVPAQAADPENLYVNQALTTCSDEGPGTKTQPFCTIGAAAAVVTAGQTVYVDGGIYPERVTFTRSGTPEAPIAFMANTPRTPVTLLGPTAGLVVDGQHDIGIQDFNVSGAVDVPALDLRNSSNIEIAGGRFTMVNVSTAPAVRLIGVTVASLRDIIGTGAALTDGLTMDATSSDVTLERATLGSGPKYDTADHSAGIRIDGPRNTIINSHLGGFTGAAVSVGPGASGTVVANNRILGGAGYGIHNRGATGTAIANNHIGDRCLGGIRVDGASSGVSLQNNVLRGNGSFAQDYCDPQAGDGVEIGVYDEALTGTVVDYNNAYHGVSPSSTSYSWNGSRMGLTQFRTVSGQATHDRDTARIWDNYDSANSAAPGYQDHDIQGWSRRDDPAVPDTGAGPVTYADRGPVEAVKYPIASFDATLDLGTSTVSVDASASTPGFVPIGSYVFNFGDGSVVTQASPVASHRYATPGTYDVTVTVIGTDELHGSSSEQVSVLRRTATVGLLALSNRRYVQSVDAVSGLKPNQTGLGATEQFDLADAGDGKIAIFSRSLGRYVATGTTDPAYLAATSQSVDVREKFTVVRNSDGSISIQASNGQYVTADPSGAITLSASRPTISTWEKFHQVLVADANRSLKAQVNGRYVSADGAGTLPLIASAPAVNLWERFDVVDLGNGQVALFARVNNRFVSADGAGSKPLIANAPAASLWEKFTMVRNSDGTVSFKAAVNSRYVSADGAGSKPLIANGPAINLWEKFTLG